MSKDLLAQAKKCLPLSVLMEQLGFGDRAQKSARCMFHDDSSASFSFYFGEDGAEHWKCHAGCGQGDAIDFLAMHLGLSNSEACREFIRRAGVLPPPLPPPPQQPPSPASIPPFFDWQACIDAFTPEHRANLATWRDYSPEFVEWLHGRGLIGLHDGRRVAFPVHNSQGQVIACHFRRDEDQTWRYHPLRTQLALFIIGDLAQAKTVFAFESQWDLFAILDRLQHHITPLVDTAFVATRGASNGRILAGRCHADAVVYAFVQNDGPAYTWLGTVAANSGRTTLQVVTPLPHLDANDWTRAGATGQDILAAIAAAKVVAVEAIPDLRCPPPKKVSKPYVVEPEADEPDAEAVFPIDCLPPIMASMISAVAETERVPIALPAVCVIAVVSAALGAGLEVASGGNRRTRGNLPLAASAESGCGKSEVFRIVAAPLVDYQARIIEDWKSNILVKAQTELGLLKREIKKLESKAANASEPKERDRLLGELKYKREREIALVAMTTMPCIIAQDVTTERLAVLLRDNRELICSFSADARKIVDNLMGRYSPGNTTDESLYLSTYSGDYIRVDRQGRDPVVLNKPCMVLCWLFQPDMMDTILNAESLSASGFVPRLLICETKATPRRIEGPTAVISEVILAQWAKLVVTLLATFHTAAKPSYITPTPEALQIFIDYHNRIVDRRLTDLADVGSFAARYAENAWRLAVVLHAALWAEEAANQPMTVETATSAVRIVEWFSIQQLKLLARGRHAAATKVEDEVLALVKDYLNRHKRDYITARDVQRAHITATADAAKALLERMVTEGLLTTKDVTPAHGGKPTREYRTVRNPVQE